jgi:hypothetical protein
MSDLETMQKLLDIVLTRIEDAEDQLKTLKAKNNPALSGEILKVKKLLAGQQRVKITLIQSIQEITPGSNVMTIFTPLKVTGNFFSKLKGFFRG